MTYKLYLMLYATIVFISYVVGVYLKYGVLKSISESYYRIKNKALFTLFIWSVSIPTIIVGETPLLFFAGALLSFVGAAPAFREDVEGKVHVVGATGGIILGFASMAFEFHNYWLAGIMLGFLAFALPKRLPKKLDKEWINGITNYTWWIEIVAFSLLAYGLYKYCVFA